MERNLKECHEPLVLWPEGYRVIKDKLYFQERLTIPSQFQEVVIQEYHQFMGHLGKEIHEHVPEASRDLSGTYVLSDKECLQMSGPPPSSLLTTMTALSSAAAEDWLDTRSQ